MSGTLYICGTPIGNLEDLTSRVGRILGEVDLIAAEDTRQSRKLLSHLGLSVRLTSYHEHNKRTKGQELLAMLREGQNIAIVTDAGMPGISDPGQDIIRDAIDLGIPVVPIPGPTAFVTALVVSGLPAERFFYGGFLPRTSKEIRELLFPLASLNSSLVFYEAPHRVDKSLKVVLEVLGDRKAALCRELTKKYEEVIRGRISEIIEKLESTPARGELTLVIGPAEDKPDGIDGTALDADGIKALLKQEIESGATEKDAVKTVANKLGLPKNEVYQTMLLLKKESE